MYDSQAEIRTIKTELSSSRMNDSNLSNIIEIIWAGIWKQIWTLQLKLNKATLNTYKKYVENKWLETLIDKL